MKIEQIYHVGLTVSDLDRSVDFYRDVLGFVYLGEVLMEGKETDALFQRENCKVRVAYLNSSDKPFVSQLELIQFVDDDAVKYKPDLFTTSISELCFYTADIDKTYHHLQNHQVECLSEPQEFNFMAAGFGKSRAFYFRDPDGIILEMMQPI